MLSLPDKDDEILQGNIYLAWWRGFAEVDIRDGGGQSGGNESKEPLHDECLG